MFDISQETHGVFSEQARQKFIAALGTDLRKLYPERFAFMTPPDLDDYIRQRIAYGAHFGITREDCVALMCFSECDAGEDFPKDHGKGWWTGIIADDSPQDFRIGHLATMISHVEVDPRYRPMAN